MMGTHTYIYVCIYILYICIHVSAQDDKVLKRHTQTHTATLGMRIEMGTHT